MDSIKYLSILVLFFFQANVGYGNIESISVGMPPDIPISATPAYFPGPNYPAVPAYSGAPESYSPMPQIAPPFTMPPGLHFNPCSSPSPTPEIEAPSSPTTLPDPASPSSDPYPSLPELAPDSFSMPPLLPVAPSSFPIPSSSPYTEAVPELVSYPNLPDPASPMSQPPYQFSPLKGIKAAYWPSFNSFPASSIDISLFTHIYYAFLLPEPSTFKLNLTSDDLIKIPEFINLIRSKNPPVKALLSIGGGGSNKTVFSQMANSGITRDTFIRSTIEVARKYGFHGVDLDWEFPKDNKDMSNLALLYKEWNRAIFIESVINRRTRLLLTSAVYYASEFIFAEPIISYPAKAMRKYLDWMSPMCFDYHGSWENFTGAPAALYDPTGNLSTSYGIVSWIRAGVPAEKLVMGMPLYGKTWKLKDPSVNSIGALAVGARPGDQGSFVYNAIVDLNKKNGATVVYDSKTVSFYSYAGDIWIGYDDALSIKKKVQFARSVGLAGYFFWALGQDKEWALSTQGDFIIIVLCLFIFSLV